MKKYNTPSMIQGDCLIYTDGGKLEGLTRDQILMLNSPGGFVDVLLSQMPVHLTADQLFKVSNLLSWTSRTPLLYYKSPEIVDLDFLFEFLYLSVADNETWNYLS